ncbi:cytochrome d ubiquinol oxidase subunit II [Thermaerobacillus caldiproteolyticus]|uniref:cytochrome d ubiquinol oxidase subunit II n=1 Tax=Thermaerobacillus caldiproteolyticus TaxID=247480 RepID=UPI00188CF455|nr:cytochrome d ubiquinol oxidase subunit II [Anoxybacillus caldiproteolyticus]QPA32487.1 cytochrome d ubiquinol oxidase subunit II [Anoxybacillus caldiproteolyticus]
MELSEIWFVLISVLFIGFFFLEGFDFGVGMSTRFLARDQKERTIMVNTIGPFWDANEVWLITGAGAIFAAFPHWYATMFSGYYLLMLAVLLSLIGRGVAFEYRRKVEDARWTNVWDWVIFFGSLLPPFLLGVLFTSMLKGMPIHEDMNMEASFSDVMNIYSIWGGLTITLLCLLHGLTFLSLKTEGEIRQRSAALAKKLVLTVIGSLIVFVGFSWFMTDIFEVRFIPELIIVALIVLAYGLSYFFISNKREGRAFTMTGLGIGLTVLSIFVGLFPRVMVSSLNKAFNLTVYNASSGAYSLKVMTIVALTILPFVLGYTIYSYYVFRKRVSDKEHLTY